MHLSSNLPPLPMADPFSHDPAAAPVSSPTPHTLPPFAASFQPLPPATPWITAAHHPATSFHLHPHSITTSIYSTNLHPAAVPPLVSLPPVPSTATVPQIPALSLPAATSPLPQTHPSPTPPPPPPPPPHTPAPVAKHPSKPKKRASSTKRSRTKTTPNPTNKPPPQTTPALSSPLQPPQPPTQPPTSRHPRSRQSRSRKSNNPPTQTPPVHPNIPFSAQQPRQPTRALNFADAVFEQPAYRSDTPRSRYDTSRPPLKPPDKVCNTHPPTSQHPSRVQKRPSRSSHLAVQPVASRKQTTPRLSARQNTQTASVANHLTHVSQPTCSNGQRLSTERPPSQSSRQDVSASVKQTRNPTDTSCAISTMQQQIHNLSNEPNIQPAGYAGVNNFGIGYCGVNAVINGWNNALASEAGDTITRCEENEENAVESLMSLAGGILNTSGDGEREKRTSNAKTTARGVAELKEKRDCGMPMEDNFEIFATEHHLHHSAHQLARNNHTHRTYTSAIPGPASTSITNTPQPPRRPPSSADLPSRELSADYAEATPVNFRDSRDMFTRTSTPSLPHVSRNRSLTQQSSLEHYLTSPHQVREKIVSHQHPSSSDLPNSLHHPFFQQPDFSQAHFDQPLNTSQQQPNITAAQHHTSQPQPHQPMHQPVDQTIQHIYPYATSTGHPTPSHQFQSTGVPAQPTLQPESGQLPEPTLEKGTMPQTKKRPTKKRTPRDPSKVTKRTKPTTKRPSTKTPKPTTKRPATKTPKPTAKRPSTKTPKPRAPHQSKNTSAMSPPNAIGTVSDANPAPTRMAPDLQTSGLNATATPSLRLRASFAQNHAVTVPPAVASLPSSASNMHTNGLQEPVSVPTQANINALRNLPALPGVQQGQPAIPAKKSSKTLRKDTTPAKAKKAKTGNAKSRKAAASKGPTIDTVLKAVEKAVQEKNQNSFLNTAKGAVVNPAQLQTQQLSQQTVNASLSLPQEPAALSTAEAQLGCAACIQPKASQGAFNSQERRDDNFRTEAREGAVPPRRFSVKEARTGSDTPLGVSTDASSPRTESTQQTLPPDSSSAGPSDAEHPSESGNHPLAQAKKRVRGSSTETPRASNSRVKSKGAKTQQQTHCQDVSQKGSPSVPTGTQSDTVLDSSDFPGTEGLGVEKTSTPSRKRKNASKVADVNKRRKKNGVNNPQQTSSMSKKKSQRGKDAVLVTEELTEDTIIDGQQVVLPDLDRTATLKKPAVRGQTKNKAARQSTAIRKRSSSSTKTHAKDKLKRNGPQASATGARPTPNGAGKLRLCLSIRDKDNRAALVTGTKRSGDSCGSPVTPDKEQGGFRYTSKSSPQTGSRVQKSSVERGNEVENKETEAVPCFAEELKNLRTSGILKASEGITSPSASQDVLGVSGTPKLSCVLCHKKESQSDMVKHPCFPVQAFDICITCSAIISKRVEEHGAKRVTLTVPSEESITQRTTLFVMLIEEMVRHFSPTDRGHRDLEEIYNFINNRKMAEMVQRAESLSVHFDMLTVLRVALRKVGFTVRGGKLRWPAGEFSLPSFADTCALVSHAVPARIDDLRKGILPGEAAWNETFGKNEELSMQRSSCAIYEKVFNLIGLRLDHVTDCSTSDLSSNDCKVKFGAVSVGALMYRTAAMLSGTVTRGLLAASWTKEEAFRFIKESEIGLRNEPYQGTLESCSICGSSEKPQKESCSFRFSNCTECLKSFCSVCLLNVLGTSEYLLSFSDDGYQCMMCRFQKNAELCPNGKPNRGEYDRRLRLHDVTGMKKKPERRMKSNPSLLLLSPSVKANVLVGLESSETRNALGIAKFCEVANHNSIRFAMGSQDCQAFHNVCLECKQPVNGEDQDAVESEVLNCGNDGCINVMHKTCLAPQPQARRRGSRSKWSCPHHQCSKCDQRDESKLLRCRTCPTTFCKEHIPSPSEVYLFSEKSFACSNCRSFLRVPQLLRLKPQGSKAERKRNQFAQGFAIDQKKRTAFVRKLSEVSACHEGMPSAFSEFRRELEMK